MLYAIPNLRLTHHTVRLDIATPTAMRAPGEATGSFALESRARRTRVRVGDRSDRPADAQSRRATRRPACRTRANICSNAIAKARAASVGSGAQPRRARCATAANDRLRHGDRDLSGDGRQRPKCACASKPAAASRSNARPTISAPGMYTIVAQVAADTLGHARSNASTYASAIRATRARRSPAVRRAPPA